MLITGICGSGKSSAAAEIASELERRGEPYALLVLDYLSWAGRRKSCRFWAGVSDTVLRWMN